MEGPQAIYSISWLFSQGRWFSSKVVHNNGSHSLPTSMQRFAPRGLPPCFSHRVKISWGACSSLYCTLTFPGDRYNIWLCPGIGALPQSSWLFENHTFVQTWTSSLSSFECCLFCPIDLHWSSSPKYSLMWSLSLDGAQCPSWSLSLGTEACETSLVMTEAQDTSTSGFPVPLIHTSH